jgi:colanic acid/amylovoran biosynthesis protein
VGSEVMTMASSIVSAGRDSEAKRAVSEQGQIRVAILGATFETGNLGVGALTVGAIKCVLSQYPEARLLLLDYAKKGSVHTLRLDGRQTTVPLVNMRFSKKFYLPNNIAVLLLIAVALKMVPSKKVRSWLVARNRWLREIEGVDLFAAISGGDSFGDIYGLGRLIYVSLPQLLVLLLGKKLVLLPQTIGPFRGRLSRIVGRYILAHAERVYVRDYRSLRQWEEVFGPGRMPDKCEFCYDVAFALDPIAPSQPNVVGLSLNEEGRSSLIGLNISGLLFMGGYTRNNAFGLRSDYKELIYSLIDSLMAKEGVGVLLVPHVFGAEVGSESDALVCEQVFAAVEEKYRGRIGLVRGSYDQSEIKHIIGQCDFFIGSRMHACIAAVSQGIPAVAIAYSDKFLGVMETLGIPSVVVDARKLDKGGVLAAINQSYRKRALIRRHLENKMPKVRESVLSLFRPVPLLTKSPQKHRGTEKKQEFTRTRRTTANQTDRTSAASRTT